MLLFNVLCNGFGYLVWFYYKESATFELSLHFFVLLPLMEHDVLLQEAMFEEASEARICIIYLIIKDLFEPICRAVHY